MELMVRVTIPVQGPQDPFHVPKVVQLPPAISERKAGAPLPLYTFQEPQKL